MEMMLPQNISFEQNILGAILVNPDALLLVSDTLRPAGFYRDGHRKIYEAMLALSERCIEPNYINVCDALERAGTLEDVGGSPYLASLVDHPDSLFGDVEDYAQSLERKSVSRDLIFAAGKIAALGQSEDEEGVAKAEALIFDIARRSQKAEVVDLSALSYDFLERVKVLRSQPRGVLMGVSTGFRRLDFLTGGLLKGDYILIAGRPSMGKSGFLLSIAYHAVLKAGKRAILFTPEMNRDQVMERLVSMHAGVDSHMLRLGLLSDEEWERVTNATMTFADEAGTRLLIDDSQGLTPTEVRSRSLLAHKRYESDGGVALIGIDYLQKFQAKINGKRIENRVQEVSEISGKFQSLAAEMGVPLIALAQLSRQTESREGHRPQLSDLNLSGSLEQDADIVIFPYRPGYYDKNVDPGLVDLIVAKHRKGPTDELQVYFDAKHTRFRDVEG